MDRSLFERAVKLHGVGLDRLVKEEQRASFLDDVDNTVAAGGETSAPNDENTTQSKNNSSSSSSVVKQKEDRKKSKEDKAGGNFFNKLHGFIARKADLLFRQPDDEDVSLAKFPSASDAEKSDYYAILPPLEQFLEVHPDVSQKRLFDLLKVGDVVIGQILSTKEFGIFVKLLALCQDTWRFLEECEVVALLPAVELRDKFCHVASVDDFQIGDLLRALVIKVSADEQKVIISLHAKEESKDSSSLGLVTESDLPVHYRRSVLQMDTQEIYEDMLHNTVGFDNPYNVAYLGARLGLNDACPLSLMRGLQRSNFPEKEYGEPLRKWQANRWSMESVAKGVEYFKAGRLFDALQHLNKALEIDEENVEALVARGALYANKDLLSKALQDFGKALKINPNHRNANKYMCETLIERGKQHEEAGEPEKAADCYQTAIDIKPDFLEAQLCLDKINKTRTPAKTAASLESISSPSPTSPEIMSVEALRELVDPENDVSQTTKKSAGKTKKKKKKEREKDRSRKRDRKETYPGKNQSKSDKKRKYSIAVSPETSRSRSRTRHGSGKTILREERKLERSTSRKGKKETRRRSRYSTSSSRSSSLGGSSTSRSRSHQQSRRGSKRTKKHRGQRSTSYSQSSSSDSFPSSRQRSRSRSRKQQHFKSDKSSLSKRNLKFARHRSGRSVSRSRSCSPYSVGEISSGSISPKRSRQRSASRSPDRKRKMSKNETQDRSTRKEIKATLRSPSSSLYPRSRRRTLSGDSKESRSSHIDSVKRRDPQSLVKKVAEVSGVQVNTKKSISSKLDSRDTLQQSSRSESRNKFHTDETYQSRQKKTVGPSGQSPSRKREHGGQKSSDVIDIPRSLDKGKGKRETDESDKEENKVTRRYSRSDTDSSGDEQQSKKFKKNSSRRSSNSVSVKDKDVRTKKSQSSSKDAKTHGRRSEGKKRASHKDLDNYRSRSRSYSSDGSYSDTSYSSYSVSGSRSYSYSSYSSGSYSDSDDSYSALKLNQSKARSKQTNKASPRAQRKTRTSKGREDKLRGDKDADDDSESEVDTGIYEISRDHLEMYMDSKSYQLKKIDNELPLKRKKRWKSEDEEEVASDKKSRPKKRRKDKEKPTSPASVPAADKEPQRTIKQGSESRTDIDQTLVTASQDLVFPKDKTASFPLPLVLHAGNPDAVHPVKSEETSFHAAYMQASVPDASVKQSLEALVGHHQSVVPNKSSLQSIVSDVGPNQSVGHNIREGPRQSIVHDRASNRSINTNVDHQQQLQLSGNNQSYIHEAESCEVNSGANYKAELSQQKMFTSEQLSVLESISKQLTQARPNTSHTTSSRRDFDTEAAQCDRRFQDHTPKHQGSSEVKDPVQGHYIGVIMTQRSSDTFVPSDNYQEMVLPQTMERTNPLDGHSVGRRRGRWDVKLPEKDKNGAFDPKHVVSSTYPHADDKAAPVSIDYKHGQDISTTSNSSYDIKPDSSGGATYDLAESGLLHTYDSQHSSMPAPLHEGLRGRDAETVNLSEVEKRTEEPRKHSRRESDDTPRHGDRHWSRGERSLDGRPRGERSEGRTYYYDTRHDHVEDESRNMHPSRSVSKFQVVDYQHGKSDRQERSRTTSGKSPDDRYENRHHDRYPDRHHGDHHRSSIERRHSGPRGSYEHGSGDRRHYHDRDRHRDTHRDRCHSRSSDAHGGNAQGSVTPVEPKESNPFHELVSSSKDMQVASLHSEGKWGHQSSPDDMKSLSSSSSRSWWL